MKNLDNDDQDDDQDDDDDHDDNQDDDDDHDDDQDDDDDHDGDQDDDDDEHTGTLSQEYSAHILHTWVVAGQTHLGLVQQPGL